MKKVNAEEPYNKIIVWLQVALVLALPLLMSPYNYANFELVFGDKAVSVVDRSDLPDVIKSTLRNARKYAEGRGIPIDVRLAEDVENVKRLVDIKIEN